MNSLSELLSFFGPVAVIGAIASVVITRKQASDAETVNNKQWEEIDRVKKWQVDHEKESAQRRLEIELKIAKIDGNFGEFSAKLSAINDKLDALIKEVKHGNS